MKPNFTTPITTPDGARRYLRALLAADLAYHCDESAGNIVHVITGEPLFAPEDCPHLDARMAEVRALLDDPCAYLLDLMNPFPELTE